MNFDIYLCKFIPEIGDFVPSGLKDVLKCDMFFLKNRYKEKSREVVLWNSEKNRRYCFWATV